MYKLGKNVLNLGLYSKCCGHYISNLTQVNKIVHTLLQYSLAKPDLRGQEFVLISESPN